jgi:hypothetical protein
MDRTREGSTIEAIDTALPAATVVLDTNFDWTTASGSLGYLLVNDLIKVESGAILRVTATQDNGSGKQEITVVKQGGGNITAADIQVDDAFGHMANIFPEASTGPDGRTYLPVEEYNTLGILRRGFKISGSEFTNRTYLGDGESWYFEQEAIEMKEFARDREAYILFGVEGVGGPNSGKGIWTYAEQEGVKNFYDGNVGMDETDIQDMIRDLMVENVSNDIYILAGSQYLVEFQRALSDYSQGGAISYGTFGDNAAGLDFHKYTFAGKTVHIAWYELFDDTSINPAPVNGIDQTSRTDFSNASLWLDMGSDNTGKSLITLKHKELNGRSRKFVHSYINGMVSADGNFGGEVATSEDAFSIQLLSEIGVEVRLPNRLGIHRNGSTIV